MGKAISLHLLAVRGLGITAEILKLLVVQNGSNERNCGRRDCWTQEWEAARGPQGGEVNGEQLPVPDVEFITVVSHSNIYLNKDMMRHLEMCSYKGMFSI